MRIRSVKPDFWRDEITGLMVPDVALFYVGLSGYADDDGRFEWSPALIRADLDPYDAKWRGLDGIASMLEALLRLKRVVRYEVEGRTYGFIPTQKKHQKPNRPSPSKLPPPPDGLTATAVSNHCTLTAGVGEGVGEGEGEGSGERTRAARGARLGVAHPGFQAATHWTSVIWPKLSTAACPDVTTAQAQSLAGLSSKHTPAAVCAAMDAAASDSFWADKLDLETFIAKFPRWLGRKAPVAAANSRGIQPVGQDWNAKLTVE